MSRRSAMTAAGAAALAGGVTASPGPATFVLVHGAWHGGWCWRDVAAALRGAGHTVFTPTMTGMGDRLHIGTPDTGLSTHIADLIASIETEELIGVTLVLHSYAGFPGSAAADRLAGRVARVVYLDAVFYGPGKALTHHAAPKMIADVEAALIDGYRVPSFPPAAFGVTDPAQVAWLERRLTTIPWKALTEPLPPLGPGFARLPKHYIAAKRSTLADSGRSAGMARAAGWTMHELDTGHDTMVTMPAETAALLRSIAAG